MIIGSVLKDRDWCGLIIRLANGEQVTAWIDRDESQDSAGFLTLERIDNNAPARSAAWLRKAAEQKIDALLTLLDEFDGDADFEVEEDDDADREAWLQPVSLGPALRTISRRPGRGAAERSMLPALDPDERAVLLAVLDDRKAAQRAGLRRGSPFVGVTNSDAPGSNPTLAEAGIDKHKQTVSEKPKPPTLPEAGICLIPAFGQR